VKAFSEVDPLRSNNQDENETMEERLSREDVSVLIDEGNPIIDVGRGWRFVIFRKLCRRVELVVGVESMDVTAFVEFVVDVDIEAGLASRRVVRLVMARKPEVKKSE
jgi:hypothetical protein